MESKICKRCYEEYKHLAFFKAKKEHIVNPLGIPNNFELVDIIRPMKPTDMLIHCQACGLCLANLITMWSAKN